MPSLFSTHTLLPRLALFYVYMYINTEIPFPHNELDWLLGLPIFPLAPLLLVPFNIESGNSLFALHLAVNLLLATRSTYR